MSVQTHCSSLHQAVPGAISKPEPCHLLYSVPLLCIILHWSPLYMCCYTYTFSAASWDFLWCLSFFFSKMASHNTASLLPTETTAIQPSHLFPNPGPCSLLCLGCSLEGQQPLHREVGRGEGRNSFHCFS